MNKGLWDSIVQGWKWGTRVSSVPLGRRSSVRTGFRNPFVTEAERERRETMQLYDEVKATFVASTYSDEKFASRFMFEIVEEACERAGVIPSIPLGEAVWLSVEQLLVAEGSFFGFPDIDPSAMLTLEEGVALRNYLHRKRRFLSDDERLRDIWREKIIRIFEGALRYIPPSVISEDEEEAEANAEDAVGSLTASLIDLCEEPDEVIERIIVTMFDDDVVNARLFDPVRERLERNVLQISGIPWERRHETGKALVLPTAARSKSNAELVETYLEGTGFAEFFRSRFSFSIPFPIRFEHTLIVGGTGHGKTQLLQLLIHHDLLQAHEDNRSIIVIDSQGDLIRTISHLACFGQGADGSLGDKLLIIDPNDVEYPLCLNMFDWNRDRLKHFKPVDQEKILNGTIELYEYLFGALLGAELTQKQGVIFKYLARLMLEIPNATIQTLRQLMENGEPFRPFMAKLPGTARSFFETRFFDRSFNETKKQILTRLWGVLSNPTFERMFSNPKNKVNIFDATNSGKIILINTAKELLKQEGCAIFGRFFIALIAQAVLQRAALEPHERRSTFVYIDEARDYFDDNIEHLLNQARKYRFGMILAHQNLDQLGAGLRASIMANTSTKFAGGVSAKDASAFASEMRCASEFVHGMQKRKIETEFACYVRNLTPQAIQVSAPLGFVDGLPTLSDSDYAAIVAVNRSRYCATVAETEALLREPGFTTSFSPTEQAFKGEPRPTVGPKLPTTPPVVSSGETPLPAGEAAAVPIPREREASAPDAPLRRPVDVPLSEPAPLGRGGKQHKYLQHLIKEAASERGFKATIEEPILNGAGRVDVSLIRDQTRIACEISVTSGGEQELANIEKCIAANYGEVLIVSSQERRLAVLRKFVTAQLEPSAVDRVRFLMPDELIAYLDGLGAAPETAEKVVRGYRVRVTRQVVSEAEANTRRQAIAGVITRSMRDLKDKS